ncbi:MAG: cyclase family protein [Actinomycetaceae bacterium]|nr:cyclase family protein [Arcanobacterium sp.]MDD7686380.1 cyclase family protein [Actinomycetaceae bacterium]MDY5272660.1 cyclase family protein [Arcanobacterium sp.]
MASLNMIDLSMPIAEHWRFTPAFENTYKERPHFTFETTNIHITTHSFSHVDAPSHIERDGVTIDRLPLETFAGDASIIDLSDLGDNAAITEQILKDRSAHVRAGDIVLLRSDQGLRHPTETKEYWTRSPWVSLDGARFLLSLQVKAVAFDFPQDRCIRFAYDESVQPLPEVGEDDACHLILLQQGVLQYEYLQNFHRISQERFLFLGFPLNIQHGNGSPIRAVAIEGEHTRR